jgi:hypothetical protein
VDRRGLISHWALRLYIWDRPGNKYLSFFG